MGSILVGELRSLIVHGQEKKETAERSPGTGWAASLFSLIWQWNPWTLLCAQHPVGVSKRRVSALHGLTPKNLAEFPHIHLWIPSFSYKNSHNSSEKNIMEVSDKSFHKLFSYHSSINIITSGFIVSFEAAWVYLQHRPLLGTPDTHVQLPPCHLHSDISSPHVGGLKFQLDSQIHETQIGCTWH